ncbi:glycosyltransferase family 2 protein [Pseudonocardia petroleophila]|uniref:Glycosyltransferase family 2 protein n=1 Tax=Pseudonocardia petroleophila TaxID=37331 RepID=A0A7G7MQI6_9PSEU|nr:glycosyltransferase family 2 protein [Pseudonocardia petroleophila]QNG55047.1 glycosyltransferase family 2 protein [Pseudonocardia petroleophila]
MTEQRTSEVPVQRTPPDEAPAPRTPRLSIGLPVYNGERYLPEALRGLLGQTFGDFELVVSDNASTDATEAICRAAAERDPRVRYVRQPRNIGLAGNHNAVFTLARGELFKWAADDDVYDPDLLARCVAALDAAPGAVLAHCWTAVLDEETGETTRLTYPLTSAAPRVADRFRSLLWDSGGDDDYGVIRSEVLRRVRPYDSFYNADRTLVAELALHGPFVQVPEWLYVRREHAARSSRGRRDIRAWCASYDRRRADRLRHPVVRLLAEYAWAYVTAIHRSPLRPGERLACYGHLLAWLLGRAATSVTRGIGAHPVGSVAD